MSENKSNKRRFLQGTAVLVAALSGGLIANAADAAVSSGMNKPDGAAQPEFVVSTAAVTGAEQYQHDSHSSHQSHSSHASHTSHSSHYSNAG
jgi:iron complex outermembrane recepter protein